VAVDQAKYFVISVATGECCEELEYRQRQVEQTPADPEALEAPAPRSILALRGLGKEHWAGTDATEHVHAELRSWD
jgi:hypothetical protein